MASASRKHNLSGVYPQRKKATPAVGKEKRYDKSFTTHEDVSIGGASIGSGSTQPAALITSKGGKKDLDGMRFSIVYPLKFHFWLNRSILRVVERVDLEDWTGYVLASRFGRDRVCTSTIRHEHDVRTLSGYNQTREMGASISTRFGSAEPSEGHAITSRHFRAVFVGRACVNYICTQMWNLSRVLLLEIRRSSFSITRGRCEYNWKLGLRRNTGCE